MIDIIVPVEQEGTQAVVRAWLKSVGDRVEVNDPLVELETDKVAVEVPAPAAGILREIVLDSNAEALPGAVLGRIATVAEAADEAFLDLDAPVSRLTMPDIPSPHNAVLLNWAVPSVEKIRAKIDDLVSF